MNAKNLSEQLRLTLENKLAGTLKQVQPPTTFVENLRGRINFAPQAVVLDRLNNSRFLLVTLGGVLSALLLVVTLGRVFYYLSGRSK